MGLEVDARVQRALAHGRHGQAVLITVVGNYGLPGEIMIAEWRSLDLIQRDPDLVLLDVVAHVPVYALRRVASYARWRPLRLTAHGPSFWPTLAVEHAAEVWHDVVYWERTHPGLHDHTPHAPAA